MVENNVKENLFDDEEDIYVNLNRPKPAQAYPPYRFTR